MPDAMSVWIPGSLINRGPISHFLFKLTAPSSYIFSNLSWSSRSMASSTSNLVVVFCAAPSQVSVSFSVPSPVMGITLAIDSSIGGTTALGIVIAAAPSGIVVASAGAVSFFGGGDSSPTSDSSSEGRPFWGDQLLMP